MYFNSSTFVQQPKNLLETPEQEKGYNEIASLPTERAANEKDTCSALFIHVFLLDYHTNC